MPWYISRGNHDGLIQGNAPASTDLFRAIAIGCLKVFPSAQIDPGAFVGVDESALFAAVQRPGVHRLAARRRPPRAAGSGPPDRLQGASTAR